MVAFRSFIWLTAKLAPLIKLDAGTIIALLKLALKKN